MKLVDKITYLNYNCKQWKKKFSRFYIKTKENHAHGVTMLSRILQTSVCITIFLFSVIILPFFLVFYLFCYLHQRVVALFVQNRAMSLLSGTDALTGQNTDTCNAIISVLSIINGVIRREDVKKLMLQRVVLARDSQGSLLFPNFSRYITTVGDYLVWHNEQHFNIDNHVIFYDKALPKTEEELKGTVNVICNTPMDANRSGWQVIIVPLEKDFFLQPGNADTSCTSSNQACNTLQQSTCVMWRFHHSVGDGVSLARLVMEHLAENNDELAVALQQRMSKWNNAVVDRKWPIFNFFINLTAIMCAPWIFFSQMFSRERNIIQGPKLNGRKIVDWSKPMSLQTVKDIKNATNTTVNDVMLSCLAGSLKRYFDRHNVTLPARISTVIPITLQNEAKPLDLGNKISFVVINVATTTATDALHRLQLIKSTMDIMKRSPQIIINQWWIQNLINVIPNTVTKWCTNKSRSTIIASNVPGPYNPVKILGHKITQVVPFLPHRGRTGVSIGIFSYVGEIRLGISVDSALIKTNDDARLLIEGFNEELNELCQLLKI